MSKKTGKRNYLSGREIRAIAKENAKVMKRLEAYKYRKAEEEEFLTELKNEENIFEPRKSDVDGDVGVYNP